MAAGGLWHDDARHGIESHRFRKGLVNRPSREHLPFWLDTGLARLRGDTLMQSKVRPRATSVATVHHLQI